MSEGERANRLCSALLWCFKKSRAVVCQLCQNKVEYIQATKGTINHILYHDVDSVEESQATADNTAKISQTNLT